MANLDYLKSEGIIDLSPEEDAAINLMMSALLIDGLEISRVYHNALMNHGNNISIALTENDQYNDAGFYPLDSVEEISAHLRELKQQREDFLTLRSQFDQESSNMRPTLSRDTSNTQTTVQKFFKNNQCIDSKSVYVGNLNYAATKQDLLIYFQVCGNINRITILCDRFNGHPRGFAYIEFHDVDSAIRAMTMDGTLFLGRLILVRPKRINKPRMEITNHTVASRGEDDDGYGRRGGYSQRRMYHPY